MAHSWKQIPAYATVERDVVRHNVKTNLGQTDVELKLLAFDRSDGYKSKYERHPVRLIALFKHGETGHERYCWCYSGKRYEKAISIFEGILKEMEG